MQSALYRGWVSHRRRTPTAHAFRYRTCLLWIDLAELDGLFRGRWLWSTRRPALARFRREDYLAPHDRPLEVVVKDLVEARTGHRPAGAVRMLTHLRYFGYCFNPVTFYYCYDGRDELEAVVAEVTNTPWRERFQYVLPIGDAHSARGRHEWRFQKQFHVSPFLPMDLEYEWRCNTPGARLGVSIASRRHGADVFQADLALERRPLAGRTLALALAAFPFQTAVLVARIHWQALRLWLKGTPFLTHPGKRAAAAGRP